MQEPKDAQLVRWCLEGDTDAFGELIRRYQSAVYATAFYYVGRYGAAEDVAQESFWAAYRSLANLREPEKFGPWLKEVTTRASANWLRRNIERIRKETPLPHRRTISIEDARKGPGANLESAERFERVQMAVDTLPERYRLPVVLRYIQELSYEEISRFTGESRDEVRGVLHRAGRQLRDVLAELDEEEGISRWPRANK